MKDSSKSQINPAILSLKNLSTLSNIFKDLKKEKMYKMSTPSPITYPLYIKQSNFWSWDSYYYDPEDSKNHFLYNRSLSVGSDNIHTARQIGTVTYYTNTPPNPLPTPTENMYRLTGYDVEQTTDPHVFTFYKKYKYLAVITLDDPDKLVKEGMLRPDYYVCMSSIPSTSAVIFKDSTPYRAEYERCRISIFDTNDRINYRGADNITSLGYNAIRREDLLPPDQIVWNNYSFCKYSESNSDRATYVIDEQYLKSSSYIFLANKKTNDVTTFVANNIDFMDIVATYLDDDTADSLAVIKPSQNLAYTDTLLLKSKTLYTYKGEFINERDL